MHLIVELSSSSPNSLAALARTHTSHTSYRREAEKALYHTLLIRASSDNSLKCMKTLATNPRKAALVRFLTIEYTYIMNGNLNCEQEVTTYLLKSLINMHSLSDFRLISRNSGTWMKDLSKILWLVCKILFFFSN